MTDWRPRAEQKPLERAGHTEMALRESEQLFRTLASHAPVGIFLTDGKGECLFVNERWCMFAGVSAEQARGQGWLSVLHPEDRDHVSQEWQVATQAGREFVLDYRFQTPEGRVTWLHGTATYLRDDQGTVRGFVGTVTDITERRDLEARVLHAQKLESLGVLAGGIAHDFNNLLAGIQGHAELALRQLPDPSPARQQIQHAVEGVQRAAELTAQMLAYSGRGRFVVEPLNLSHLTEDMTRLLQVSISKLCTIRYDLMKDLPAVEADAAQMRQVVMNLIINASEAIGDRSGVITATTGVLRCERAYLTEIHALEDLPEGPYVYLDVSDTGSGIPEETQAKLFDPFFTTKVAGRGLGLSAVLGIVRGHRGAIALRSKPGQGTTFRVLLPVCNSPAETPGARQAPKQDWVGTGVVLIVDDENAALAVTRLLFEEMGFEVLTAQDGRQGVELFRVECDRIRLVMLDLTMPILGGVDALREMHGIRSTVRAILSSGYAEEMSTNELESYGLVGFLQKPYRLEDLMAVVRNALEGEAVDTR